MAQEMLGFTCAYTPLPVISAAGFTPYRVLPDDCNTANGAGQFLHDNLCPHVKLLLERAIDGALPAELVGMVFINSCDAMRRLEDAWKVVRAGDKTVQVDLPPNFNPLSLSFFADEIRTLSSVLAAWSGKGFTESALRESLAVYDSLSQKFSLLRAALQERRLPGGAAVLQGLYNAASTEPLACAQEKIDDVLTRLESGVATADTVNASPRVFLLGNVMPRVDFFEFFSSCGIEIIAEDMCTGSRLFPRYPLEENGEDVFTQMSRAILTHPACARSFDNNNPGDFATKALQQVRQSAADAVIIQTMKFCDPYLARLPPLFEALKNVGIPFLFLEGDCSLRSLGQYKTRVEAFAETLQ